MDMPCTSAFKTFPTTTAADIGLKILAAIAFWIMGRWLVGKVIGLIQAGMGRNNVDPTLTTYLGSIVSVVLHIALVLENPGLFRHPDHQLRGDAGRRRRGHRCSLARHAWQLRRPGLDAGTAAAEGGRLRRRGGVTGTVHEPGLFGTTIITPD